MLAEIEHGLCLVTTRCSCEYLAEVSAFDEVLVRMRLGDLVQNRILLEFEYWRRSRSGEELVARGEQRVLCMRRDGASLVGAYFPQLLSDALLKYARAD